MSTTTGNVSVELYSGANDHLVELSLAKLREQVPLTGATVEVRVTDASGADVTGVVWPIALVETDQVPIVVDGVSITAQRYAAVIDAVADIQEDRRYTVKITSTHPEEFDDEFEVERVARRRTG